MDSGWRTELLLNQQQQEQQQKRGIQNVSQPPLDTSDYLHNLKVRLARLKKYTPIVAPNNITVNFRTRRNRHRNEDDLDDNLSVISRSSRQSFGRFDRLNKRNPLPSSSQHRRRKEPTLMPKSHSPPSQPSLSKQRLNQQPISQLSVEQQSFSQRIYSQQSLSQGSLSQQPPSQQHLEQQSLSQQVLTKETLRQQQYLYTQSSIQPSQTISEEPSSPTMDWEIVADDLSPSTAPLNLSPPVDLDDSGGPRSSSVNNNNTEWQTISNIDDHGKQPQTDTTNGDDDSTRKLSLSTKR